jgi:hypothetical protein
MCFIIACNHVDTGDIIGVRLHASGVGTTHSTGRCSTT